MRNYPLDNCLHGVYGGGTTKTQTIDYQAHCECGHWESNHDPHATLVPRDCQTNDGCPTACAEWQLCGCGTVQNHRRAA